VNTPGTYGCRCKDGYKGDGETTCLDIDECLLNTYNCSAYELPNAVVVSVLREITAVPMPTVHLSQYTYICYLRHFHMVLVFVVYMRDS